MVHIQTLEVVAGGWAAGRLYIWFREIIPRSGRWETDPCLVLRFEDPDVICLDGLVQEVEAKDPAIKVEEIQEISRRPLHVR